MRFSLTEIVGEIGGGNTATPEPTGSGRLIRPYEPLIRPYEPHQTMALIRTVGAQSSKI